MRMCKKSLLFMMVVLMLPMSGCSLLGSLTKTGLPEKGIWYCEELSMQISFDTPTASYIIQDGEKVGFLIGYDPGSDVLSAAYLWDGGIELVGVPNGPYDVYDSEKEFFVAECDYWDEDKMILTQWLSYKGTLKGDTYLFVRVDKGE